MVIDMLPGTTVGAFCRLSVCYFDVILHLEYRSAMLTVEDTRGRSVKYMKRVFLIVLDSVGIGEEPDAAE